MKDETDVYVRHITCPACQVDIPIDFLAVAAAVNKQIVTGRFEWTALLPNEATELHSDSAFDYAHGNLGEFVALVDAAEQSGTLRIDAACPGCGKTITQRVAWKKEA